MRNIERDYQIYNQIERGLEVNGIAASFALKPARIKQIHARLCRIKRGLGNKGEDLDSFVKEKTSKAIPEWKRQDLYFEKSIKKIVQMISKYAEENNKDAQDLARYVATEIMEDCDCDGLCGCILCQG